MASFCCTVYTIPNVQASWQWAGHLVLKGFSIQSQRWQLNFVQSTQNEANHVADAKYWVGIIWFHWKQAFCMLGFIYGSLQCLSVPQSFDACGMISMEGSFMSKRVAHRLNSASAYLQSTNPSLFDKVHDHITAWKDNVIMHAKMEVKLLSTLKMCFNRVKKFLSPRPNVLFIQEHRNAAGGK